jgi:glycosyltransferase involved in cell wall biosynthesis
LKNILFVPDTINSVDSGGRSASQTIKMLFDMGYSVGIYSHDNLSNKFEKITYYKRSEFRMKQHFFHSKIKNDFKMVLKSFKPDFLFFAGSTINKPLIYYKICIKNKIPFVFIDYCASYFCLKIFSGLSDGPCIKCINGNFFNALFNKCTNNKSSKYFYWLFGSIVLFRFRKVLRNTHGAIGYGKSQLDTYNKLGIPKNKLYQTAVFIDTKGIVNNENIIKNSENYFFIFGQQRTVKGWHLLKKIFDKSSKIKYKIAIHDESKAKDIIKKWELDEFILSNQLDIVTGLSWKELKDNIINARGVILPTYWNTTGEFSLVEALGLGKPVVVFNVGFHNDYLKHNINAMVSNVGDIESYVDNIIKLDSDNELCDKISEKAYDTFKFITSFERHKVLFRKLFQ